MTDRSTESQPRRDAAAIDIWDNEAGRLTPSNIKLAAASKRIAPGPSIMSSRASRSISTARR